MAFFHTCIGCKFNAGICLPRDEIRAAIDRLRITSIKHTCKSRLPLYAPGDAVMVLTVAWMTNKDEIHEPPRLWFPAIFIQQAGKKVVAFVKIGTLSEDDEDGGYPFETEGQGYVKVPFSRTRAGSHAAIHIELCRWCGGYHALTGRCEGDQGMAADKCAALHPTGIPS